MTTVSSPAPADLYQYDSALSRRTIRLLQLEAGRGGDQIRCRLVVKPLDNHIIYNALSYTWGEQKENRTIFCDEKHFKIGENLYQALWQLRQDGRTELLWVDAMCINQEDDVEKTAQVQIMREIYEQAKLVITWLGTEGDTDGVGFSFMREIYVHLGGPSLEAMNYTSFTQVDKLDLPKINDPKWKALCRVLFKPYFFRVWIIQELLAAKQCILQCGTHIVDRSVIFAIASAVGKYHFISNMITANMPLDDSVEDNASEDLTIDELRGLFSPPSDASPTESLPDTGLSLLPLWSLKSRIDAGNPPTILDLLMSTRMFKATQPHDKIFALVGLASDISTNFIDYKKSPSDVQIELAKMCMHRKQSWGPMLFSYVGFKHLSSGLPSWVPDWTSSGPMQGPFAATFYQGRPVPNLLENWHVTSETTLTIPSKVFDEVASIIHETPYMVYTPTLRKEQLLVHNVREMNAWNDACWELAKNLGEYPTGQNLLEAFWRTLICNTAGPGTEASEKFEFSYGTWVGLFESGIEILEHFRPFVEGPRNDAIPDPPSSALGVIRGLGTKISNSWKLFTLELKVMYKLGMMQQQEKSSAPFEKAFKQHSLGRKFCTTINGYMGWVPLEAREGDRICYFEGCKLPFVIRPCEGQYHQLVGDCYLHGLMHDPPPGLDESKPESITLV